MILGSFGDIGESLFLAGALFVEAGIIMFERHFSWVWYPYLGRLECHVW